MDELTPIPVVEVRDGKPVTTSLQVAKYFGKRHDNVLRDIDRILRFIPVQDHLLYFEETITTRPNPKGGEPIKSRMYLMSFDGFSLLVMGFTGPKAMEYKVAYTKQFRRMADALSGSRLNKLEKALKAVVAFDRAKQVASDAGRALANWRLKKPLLANARDAAIEEAQPALPLL